MIELPDNIRKEIEAEVFKQHHTTDFYIIDTVWDVIASHLVERYPATMAWRIELSEEQVEKVKKSRWRKG